jgi:hypothetical protein
LGHQQTISIYVLIQSQRAVLEEDGIIRIVGSRCIAKMLRGRLSLLTDREIADLFCSVRRGLYTFSPERIISDEVSRRLVRSNGGPSPIDEIEWDEFRSVQPSTASPD